MGKTDNSVRVGFVAAALCLQRRRRLQTASVTSERPAIPPTVFMDSCGGDCCRGLVVKKLLEP